MPYLEQYKLRYQQISSEFVTVTIYKTSSFAGSGTPVITDLIPATDAPFTVNFDSDKNKYKPIKGKQAQIVFLSQTGVTASTFSTGPDDEWLVEAVVDSSGFILFKGYLVMDDHQQSFLPVGTYTVTLSATDNLGTLKDVALTDDSGNYIRGYKKKIEIIAQCLKKTGLQLDIIVRDTWMEETQSTFRTGLDFAYHEMKTFEKGINEAVDCYKALEIICTYHLSIKQYNGQWWVENIDEKTSNDVYAFKFDYTGAYVSDLTVEPYNKTIGKTHSIKLTNANALVNYTRPNKFVKLNYNYDPPAELIDNMDFSRGAYNAGITVPTGYKAYDLDDWVKKQGTRSGFWTSATTGTQVAYIQRKFENDYEKERFIVIDKPSYSYSTEVVWIQPSSPIPVGVNDKFIVSLDWQMFSDITGSGTSYVGMYAILLGDDSTTYIYWANGLHYNGSRWWPMSVITFPDDRLAIETEFQRANTNETEWQTMSGEIEPLPVSGQLLFLIPLPEIPGVTKMKFTNFQVDYFAYINGSYQKYSGHSFKVEQNGNYKANINDQVYIGDAPRKLFKGAMFKLVSGAYVLTERWFAGGDLLRQGIVPPYPPIDDYLHPFGWLQLYAVWNQYNRRFVAISGSAKGLEMSGDVPDLIHDYTIDAAVPETENKTFMLVGAEHDYKGEKWNNASFIEVEDSTIDRDFSAPLTFKFEGGVV